MAQGFCSNCGAKLATAARFCVECGTSLGGTGTPWYEFIYGRYAPAILLAVTILVGGVVIWVGSLVAPPPPRIPGREAGAPAGAGSAGVTLPQGHPPIALPKEVREKIQQKAAAAKDKPDDLDLWIELGAMQYEASEIEPRYVDEAVATFSHVVEKDPNNLKALRSLGNLLYDSNQADRAIAFFERYLALRPNDSEVQTDMATMYLGKKDVAKAIALYQQVLAADPTFFQAQFNLAIAYRESGDPHQELAALEKARDLAPNDDAGRQVEMIIARVKARPTAGAAPATVTGGGFAADVEAFFRTNQVLGPKLDHIDWMDARTAKVLLREFPMDNMPEDMRAAFAERIRTSLQETKARYQMADAVRVDLVDAASGRVMTTVTQ